MNSLNVFVVFVTKVKKLNLSEHSFNSQKHMITCFVSFRITEDILFTLKRDVLKMTHLQTVLRDNTC